MSASINIFSIWLFLASLLVLQVLWVWAKPPLLHKPRTWFIGWPLKANLAVVPAMSLLLV